MTINCRTLEIGAIDDPSALMKELERRDFVYFLVRAFAHLNGGDNLIHNWHLDAVAYELKRVASDDCRRLLVTMPPRMLKSMMISVAWVAWRLGQDPKLTFVCVSYSNELSGKHARDCRAVMQSGWYRNLFPGTKLRAQRTAVHDFETTAGGGRLATSVGGTLTGRGGDIIIIDDPIKPEDAASDTVRKSVNDWYRSTLASRLNDKARGVIITVMQRLHEDDLAGMLLENGGWHELSLPAIAYEDSVIPLTRGGQHHRHTGDLLHPERESREVLMAQKLAIGTSAFEAQYQQRPLSPEGKIIAANWLKTYDKSDLDPPGQIIISCDTANKDGLFNDWSVIITARLFAKKVYILNVVRKKMQFPALVKAVTEQSRLFHASVLLIEDQASGQQLIQHLRNDCPPGVPRPIGRRPEADKKTRLAGVSPMIEAGQLYLPEEASWLGEFKHELLGFPSTRHDDQVDALSQLLTWVARQNRYTYGDSTPIEYPQDPVGGTHCVDGLYYGEDDYGEDDPDDMYSGV